MTTHPIQSSPVVQHDAAVKTAAPRPNRTLQQSAVPQDKVTLSPQARQAVSAKAVPGGGKK
jgi:hypothetical protein